MTYQPTYVKGYETGLVQEREEFILPADAFPILENAFVWRERIKRKQGTQLLGRLRRVYTATSIGLSAGPNWFFNLYSTLAVPITEPNAEIKAGSLIINIGATQLIDDGRSVLNTNPISAVNGIVNYATGDITIFNATPGVASTAAFSYFPMLPVMGLLSQELDTTNNEKLIAFDTIYAYEFVASQWEEFIPGTTWSGNDSDFFWSTNYWTLNNVKLFWVTNFSGKNGDPIRYTNGINWFDFGASSIAPKTGLITPASGGNPDIYLNQCRCLLPFRSRMIAFNTWEGNTLLGSIQYPQRIRWAAIGNPLVVDSAGPPATVGAWRDDVRGRGGFLDIPTSEEIISVGFVRDNLVIYCERSTWQLRYTGRSISPFQIEKVNTELGAESTFSAIQFDTSLVGIGDKGVVECDSYKSERIDIKIPDLVFYFNNDANGQKRVYGIRDFQQRLAYWTYPYKPDEQPSDVFPNRRLVYNYENDSWAIFTDSFTCFGTFQPSSGRRWLDYVTPTVDTWENQNYPWINRPSLFPAIVAGNQQGFVSFIDSQVKNGASLSIKNIQGLTPNPTRITSINHNLETGQIIEIFGIPNGTDWDILNGDVFYVQRINNDDFDLYTYDPNTGQFSQAQINNALTYEGAGKIAVLDNFRIVSKKFNFLEQGETIQLGYIDVLMDTTTSGAVSLNVYVDYNNNSPVNTLNENIDPDTELPDTFFNSIVPTTQVSGLSSTKNWHRVFCPSRGSFITLEWTLSNAQMNGPEQESDVQIDTQILWMRPAGRQLPQNF